MLKVLDTELDFDITSPDDLDRYIRANEKMVAQAAQLPPMPQTTVGLANLRAYQEWVAANCRQITDWIDDIFGEGTANKLLGPKTSLSAILDTYDALKAAVTAQGEAVGARLRQFAPNRATRRAKKGQTP